MDVQRTKCDHCGKETPKSRMLIDVPNMFSLFTKGKCASYDLCSSKCLREFLESKEYFKNMD